MIGQCHLVLLKVEYYRFLELRKAMTSQVSLLLDIWFTVYYIQFSVNGFDGHIFLAC